MTPTLCQCGHYIRWHEPTSSWVHLATGSTFCYPCLSFLDAFAAEAEPATT